MEAICFTPFCHGCKVAMSDDRVIPLRQDSLGTPKAPKCALKMIAYISVDVVGVAGGYLKYPDE